RRPEHDGPRFGGEEAGGAGRPAAGAEPARDGRAGSLTLRAAALALALMLAPAAAAQEAPAVPVYGFEVVRVWPHDRTAFTQGLVWHDGALLEITGRYPSTVRRVRLEDGEVLDLRTLDTTYFGEGLTELDGRVFTLT